MTLGFVRPARLDDVVEITRIQLTTWRVAYRRLLPQHVLDQLDEDWITRRWRDAIADPPTPEHRVLVAVEQQESPGAGPTSAYVVGFAASGPADDTALAPDEDHTALTKAAAITDVLVEPRWGRRGHGSRLLAASVDLWRTDGFTTALAWTFADDRVTRRFLESSGWAPDGVSRSLDVDDLLVPQIRWHVSLETEEGPAVTAM
ncbi:GNAT family N-acetyltransferase [Dactylosporangium aurantiacum]|uniref:GNAT family N-acetyltransferase n=1 Tax=Dactylosporangium aurantiacum TaxID=35754 RepID=A0A9Q9IIB3_9ACTN|nr:GNAT family N-acetyltransferase [Dactylosporangium aurantiacum]MDG6104523.1 GNAT family N-acetyltransferase [Dactylosporangium aurantiacum]UWZ56136.1 GNAT family N-acetyltransferase [Dactylosporangium aurantiacum]